MREWTTKEEQVLLSCAGKVPLKQIAFQLNRTQDSVACHAAAMRKAGKLKRSLRCEHEAVYTPRTTQCHGCWKMRATVDESGLCKVCRDKKRLAKHRDKAEQAYENLPAELRARADPYSVGSTRKACLAKRDYAEPQKQPPRRPGRFWADKAEDDYLIAHESWELEIMRLEIDAIKQRRCKWERKTREYYRRKELEAAGMLPAPKPRKPQPKPKKFWR